MQFVPLMAWLFLSNGLLLIPAILALESGARFWAILLAVALPLLRMVARYRSRRGYYLIGYNDGAGGDHTLHARWLNRHSHPQWFKLIMLLESLIVLLFIVSIFAR